MINETSKRRPGIDLANSHPVTLSDGQTWFVPKPYTRMRPSFKGRKAETSRVVTDDPEFNELFQAVEEHDTYLAIANLAAHMLAKNYDLSDDEMGEILTYDLKDQSPDRWPLQVMAVIYGRTGPKASSDGAV